MAIDHERVRTQHVEEAAGQNVAVMAQQSETAVERERQKVHNAEPEAEMLRLMGRLAIQYESA